MSAKRGGLGTNLDSLIPTSLTVAGNEVAQQNEVSVDAIAPNPRQPRTIFEEGALNELIASIKEIGILQPPVVRQVSPGAIAYMQVAREIAERGKPKDALDVNFDSNVVNINYKRDGEIA